MEKKERQSNIELLRIVSMIFIIFSHFSSHGNFIIDAININGVYLQIIQILGKIGVNIFVFISGYFLITKKDLEKKKLLLLWLQILFYSIVMYFIFEVFMYKRFSITSFIKSCFPITLKHWWFASTYFVLYLLHPYVNRMLNSLDRAEYKKLLMILTILWCILPTLTTKELECNNLLWFLYLYSLSGYLKLYPDVLERWNLKKCTLFTLVSFLIAIVLIVLFDCIKVDYRILFGIQKLPTLIISILVFILFNKISIKNNKYINNIAKQTFGIYLIHDNYIIRNFIWKKVFKVSDYYNSNFLHFISYTLLVVLAIFIVCGIIEFIRKYVESKMLKLIH